MRGRRDVTQGVHCCLRDCHLRGCVRQYARRQKETCKQHAPPYPASPVHMPHRWPVQIVTRTMELSQEEVRRNGRWKPRAPLAFADARFPTYFCGGVQAPGMTEGPEAWYLSLGLLSMQKEKWRPQVRNPHSIRAIPPISRRFEADFQS